MLSNSTWSWLQWALSHQTAWVSAGVPWPFIPQAKLSTKPPLRTSEQASERPVHSHLWSLWIQGQEPGPGSAWDLTLLPGTLLQAPSIRVKGMAQQQRGGPAAGTRYTVTLERLLQGLLGPEEGEASVSRVCGEAHPPPTSHYPQFKLLDLLWLGANYKTESTCLNINSGQSPTNMQCVSCSVMSDSMWSRGL